MSMGRRVVGSLGVVCGLWMGVVGAQEDLRGEVEELERLLARVREAREALEPVVRPAYRLEGYDVRHLQLQVGDRSAPALTIPSDSAGFATGQGEGGTFSFDDTEESRGNALDEDQLVELVEAAIGEPYWDEPAWIQPHRGYLWVYQTEARHAEVRALLGSLYDEVRCLQYEVGFYRLPGSWEQRLEEARFEARGELSEELLGDLDVGVSTGEVALSTSVLLSAMNGQQVYLHYGDERSLLVDYERSSGGTGQTVESVADPIVDVLRGGIALDVRGSVLPGEIVSMNARLTRSRLEELAQRNTPWGAMDIPRVQVEQVRTSARVQTGGGMLIYTSRGQEGEIMAIVVRPRVQ